MSGVRAHVRWLDTIFAAVPMSRTQHFLRENLTLLLFGFLCTFLSGFGQTFLISLYVPTLQEAFGLSNSGFSGIYAVATLGSAFTLAYAGRFIDRLRITTFVTRVLAGLALGLVLFAFSMHAAMLLLALYMLRLFGQGLLTHTALTSMARFFDLNRGKALSMAVLGYPAGEALMPIAMVSLMAVVGWRGTALASAVVVVCCMPIVLRLLMRGRDFAKRRRFVPTPLTSDELRSSRPMELLRNRTFWVIAPSTLVAGSIGTGMLFFQLKIGEHKGWDAAFIAAAFSSYALGNAISSLLAGWLADRFTGQRLFPLYLLPTTVGTTVFFLSDAWWVYVVFIMGIGITNGFGGPVKNAALAELFGTRILGSVRSFFTTVMVFSTALGPVIMGTMLDAGIGFERIAMGAVAVFVLASLNALRVIGLRPSSG